MTTTTTTPTTVVKVGGAMLTPTADFAALGSYLRALLQRHHRVVVVHGGGDEIAAIHTALGVPTVKKAGLRVTPDDSMDIVTMVLCGLVNKRLVSRLLPMDIPALGISGVDLGLLSCQLLNEAKLGRVGSAPTVRTGPLELLLEKGIVPVVAPVSLGPDAEPANVNADVAAHAISVALNAHSLDFVCDVDGVRGDGRLLGRITGREVRSLIRRSVITGGMIPKLQAALAALDAGVGRVRVGSLTSLPNDLATEVTA